MCETSIPISVALSHFPIDQSTAPCAVMSNPLHGLLILCHRLCAPRDVLPVTQREAFLRLPRIYEHVFLTDPHVDELDANSGHNRKINWTIRLAWSHVSVTTVLSCLSITPCRIVDTPFAFVVLSPFPGRFISAIVDRHTTCWSLR